MGPNAGMLSIFYKQPTLKTPNEIIHVMMVMPTEGGIVYKEFMEKKYAVAKGENFACNTIGKEVFIPMDRIERIEIVLDREVEAWAEYERLVNIPKE